MSSLAYTWSEKMEAVARHMLLGNMRVVSEQLSIPYDTLMEWKRSEWWPEMVDQLRRQKKQKTSDNLTKIIENSIEIVQERLEHGDWVWDQKTGEAKRKPVGVRDAANIANSLLQRQNDLEEFTNRPQNTESVKETLDQLAKEFAKWNRINNKKNAETISFVERNEPSEEINNDVV